MTLSLTRRRLLAALAAAPLAATLPRAFAAAQPPRLFIMVFLYGGNDGFNTIVPYANPDYYRLRPHVAVRRESVIPITASHGFNAALAPLLPAWRANELALVQGIGYSQGTQQHYRDCETAFTACDGQEYSAEGWVTRALARRAHRTSAPDVVAFDTLDVRETDPMGPFRGDKLGVVEVYYASDLLALRRLDRCAIQANDRGRAALARSGDPLPVTPLKTGFPADAFGDAMRAAVELAACDRTLPIIHVALNGPDGDKHHSVDCHWDQAKYHDDALARLAAGLAALRDGLKEIGRWDETLVATYDEFGRCPMENEDRGTHHGLATTHFVLGGRVKGGLVGEAPAFERMFPYIGGPVPTIDTRRLWTTVIERWWEGDAGGVFTRAHKPLDLLRV